MTDAAGTEPGAWARKRLQASLRIELAALQLFAERGIDDVTVEQIAAAAGISTRTFFRYFRNQRDVLIALPRRETDRLCSFVMARPIEEGLLGGFCSVFHQFEAQEILERDVRDVQAMLEAVRLWGHIVQRAPATFHLDTQATSMLAVGFEEVVKARLSLGPDDVLQAGSIAVALASLVWFVFIQWVGDGMNGSVHTLIDRAFHQLASLDMIPALAHGTPSMSGGDLEITLP